MRDIAGMMPKKKLLANGVDPGAIKKRQKAIEQEQAAAFKSIAVEWHTAFKEKWTEKHSERLLTRLEQDFFPFLGDVPIKEIKAPALLELLRRVEIRSLEQAHKLQGTTGRAVDPFVQSFRPTGVELSGWDFAFLSDFFTIDLCQVLPPPGAFMSWSPKYYLQIQMPEYILEVYIISEVDHENCKIVSKWAKPSSQIAQRVPF
jgi:hypothetical protein